MTQGDTHRVSAEEILCSAEFQRGVADMRAGRRPHFDDEKDRYEWGRQFAAVVPRNLPLMVMAGRAANPKAVTLLRRCFRNGTLVNGK